MGQAGGWKKYLQWQKPMADVLVAASLPALMGVYNFGWRAAASVAVALFFCWLTEYLFTRRGGKPATMSALVTGILLALILPPNVPFWIIAVGSVFAILFGKMAFGGFGKNVFNPAMVGRCFLYISFPVFVVTTWTIPYQPEVDGPAAGFTKWGRDVWDNPDARAKSFEEQPYNIDAVTSATVLRAAKNLNRQARGNAARVEYDISAFDPLYSPPERVELEQMAQAADAPPEAAQLLQARQAVLEIPIWRLFLGNMTGSMGETSALAILLGLAYLLWRKVIFLPLLIGPLVGIVGMTLVFGLTGHAVMPIHQVLLINLFAGGTMFAVVFMTTEPVSAPRGDMARWIYAILIGVFAVIIRTMSTWPAGLMFSILLGNALGPLIEIGCDAWAARRKAAGSTSAAEE